MGRLLDVERDADAAVDAALGQLRVLAAQLLVADLLEAQFERRGVVAAFEVELAGGHVRELADEVAPPNLGRVHLEPPCDLVHQPLGRQAAVRTADAAVWPHRRLVGHHRVGAPLVVGDVVGPRDVVGGLAHVECRRHRPAGVRAVVGVDLGPDPEHAPVVAHGGRDLVDLLARLRADEQVLAAVARPLDRSAQPHREQRDERLVGMQQRLLPEAATEVGGDHADPVLRQAEDLAEGGAEQMRRLRAHPHGQLADGRLVAREARARFEAGRRVALGAQLELDREVGLRERLLDVARDAVEPDVEVVGRPLVDDGGPRGERLLDARHRLQRLVFDRHELGRVLGDVAVLRDDDRDRLTDEPDLLAR